MNARSTLRTVSLALFLFLVTGLAGVSAQTQPDPCEGLPEWKFIVEGVAAFKYLEENDDIGALLERLGIGIEPSDLVALLQQRARNPLDPIPQISEYEALRGIGGFIVGQFLLSVLDEDGLLKKQGETVVLSGKIRDYIFEKDPQNDRIGRGHLSVDMCVKNIDLGLQQFFHWDIEVNDKGFEVREESPPESTRPLDHKLAAKGQVIQVEHVYVRGGTVTRLTRIDDSDDVYQTTPASCVDLFTEGVPPETYGELVENAFCMGRCDHPLIVNTVD